MKRIDLPPTRERLLELIKADPINRNADLSDLIELLDSVEGPFTIFLDSDWGSGKTFFVRQLELVLSGLNPQLTESEKCSVDFAELLPLKDSINADSFVPIYYNAWENDHWDDPLPSLLLCLADSSDVKLSTKREKSDQEVITALIGAAANQLGFGFVGDAINALSGEELLNDYRIRQALREKVESFIAAVLQEHANRLLLIVDELDRCRPIFAVKLLETIKTLFENDSVVVLAAVNVSELAHSVEGLYGPKIDGCKYLSRFYDIKVTLRLPNTEHYLRFQGFQNTGNIDGMVARELINAFGMSLRDISRYQTSLEEMNKKAEKWPQSSGRSDSAISFARYCLAQILLAVQIFVPEDYQKIKVRNDGAVLLKYIQMSSTASKFYDQILGECLNDENRAKYENDYDSLKRNAASAFCELIWNTDENSASYVDAHSLLFGNAFGMKRLWFISRDVLP